jgi:hypothetical protein
VIGQTSAHPTNMAPALAYVFVHPLPTPAPGDHRPTVALRILAGNGSAGQDAGGPLHVWRSPVSATAAMVMARACRNGRSGKARARFFGHRCKLQASAAEPHECTLSRRAETGAPSSLSDGDMEAP